MNQHELDNIIKFAYLSSTNIKKLNISYISQYNLYYKMTINNYRYIKDWFNRLFKRYELNNKIINIKVTSDILLYPINRCKIDYKKTCHIINNNIIKRNVTIILCLKNSKLNNDIIMNICLNY